MMRGPKGPGRLHRDLEVRVEEVSPMTRGPKGTDLVDGHRRLEVVEEVSPMTRGPKAVAVEHQPQHPAHLVEEVSPMMRGPKEAHQTGGVQYFHQPPTLRRYPR
jgi:hypothetical protein